jgi:cytochrome c oxidase assembly protein subunit 16
MSFSNSKYPSGLTRKYRSLVKKHPFVLFGLPFMGIIVAGSFFLTPFTAIRYEKHDKKRKWVTNEEALASTDKTKRKVDPKEEYYVSLSVLQ